MQTSSEGIADLIGHEAIVPYRYLDSVRVDTFGIGHTHYAGAPDPRQMPFGKEYPLSKAIEVFRSDLRKFERRVNGAVKVPLKQHEYDALVSFDFNTGGIERAALTRSLNAGNRQAAASQFLNWSKPPEIIPRRKGEQRLFRDGAYSSGGMANVYPADGAGRVQWSRGRRVSLANVAPEIFAANQADDKADKDRNKAAGSGAAGAGSGAAGGGSDALPADVPVDPALLQPLLILGGLALLVAAAFFAWRWWRGRRAAIEKEKDAALALELALFDATAIEATGKETGA